MTLALLLGLLACGAPAESPRLTYGALAWKILLLQRGDVSKDVWGGRVYTNLRLAGGLHAVARVDAAALPGEQFSAGDLASYKAVEGYAGLYFNATPGRISAGPAAIAGLTRGFDLEGAELEGNPRTYGAGLRLGYRKAWLYVLAARHEAAGEGARLLAATQVPIWEGMTFIADYVGGEGGFVRLGIGYALGNAP